VWPKGISKKVFDAIFRDYDLSPGAEQTISGLKSRKVKTAVISSGIDILAEVVCERLGIGGCMANGFEFNGEGRLTGKGISRVDPYRKDAVLRSLLEYQSASPEETMGVGDTRFDVKFLEACKYRVAFRPKREDSEILANIVHYMIDDLREILVIIDSVNSTEAEISGRKK